MAGWIAVLPLKILGAFSSWPLPASSSSRCPLAYGYIPPVSASIFTWWSPECASFCLSFGKTLFIRFGTQPHNPGFSQNKSLIFIISAKILFQNKVTFAGSKFGYIFSRAQFYPLPMDYVQVHYLRSKCLRVFQEFSVTDLELIYIVI